MNLYDFLLIVFALLPAVALVIYIFTKDRVDKEPVTLLLILFALGSISGFLAYWLETGAGLILNAVFSPFYTIEHGVMMMSPIPFFIYNLINNILCIAFIEEGLKFIFMFLVTNRNRNFNCLFDGIVYAVFVSLGFAANENLAYAFSYGMATVLIRAVTSIPGHLCFAVIMGYFYSRWHVLKEAQKISKELNAPPSVIQSLSPASKGVCMLVIPTIVHGLYDFMLSMESIFYSIIFILLLIGLYIYCFYTIHKVSKRDISSEKIAFAIVQNRIPPQAAFSYSFNYQQAQTEQERQIIQKSFRDIL